MNNIQIIMAICFIAGLIVGYLFATRTTLKRLGKAEHRNRSEAIRNVSLFRRR